MEKQKDVKVRVTTELIEDGEVVSTNSKEMPFCIVGSLTEGGGVTTIDTMVLGELNLEKAVRTLAEMFGRILRVFDYVLKKNPVMTAEVCAALNKDIFTRGLEYIGMEGDEE